MLRGQLLSFFREIQTTGITDFLIKQGEIVQNRGIIGFVFEDDS